MAVIVQHRTSDEKYVLVGTGFGAYKALKPNWFFGNMMADEESGEISVVAVCNADGDIGWFRSNELRIISIDGQDPAGAISGA